MVVAGNTTMLHLLHGVDPTSMGVAPFTPTFLEHRIVEASQLRLNVKAPKEQTPAPSKTDNVRAARDGVGRMIVHSLPGAAAYVGADITAGVLATGMAYRDETCLLVDLGTNGEIVLKHNGTLAGCATAAGPAFEGAGLTFRHARQSRSHRPHLVGTQPARGADRSDWRHGTDRPVRHGVH